MARVTFDFGLNETEATQPNEALEGWNFDLELAATRLFPRHSIDLKGTTPNGGECAGIMQLIERDSTETTLIYGGAATTPTIYSWTGQNTSTAFTSERTTNVASGSALRDTYWSLDDYITITDIQKLTPLLNWDGTDLTRHKTNLFDGSTQSATLTCSSGTVTATVSTHGYSVGDLVDIAGADEATFNGEYEITTVPSADAFTYTITSCPTSTATGTITAEGGINLYAKYSVVHAGRLWLFNVTTGSDGNPHMILASAFENAESFDTVNRSGIATGNEAFYTLSPDLKEINGVAVFNKQIIISTIDGALHRLAGIDAADYSFVTYFAGSAAEGTESMANIGNDIIYVRKGGNIDLLSAVDTSGDVRADDVSRFIPDTIKDLEDALTVYDQSNQKVLFFIDDKIVVLFKDVLAAGGGSPWTVYKTELTNEFTTKAVRYLHRPQTTNHSIYFGDEDGNIYDLNGSGFGDNGEAIVVNRKTPLTESSRADILRGYIQYRRIGEFNVSLSFDWANEYNISRSDLTLKGPPFGQTLDSYWGGDAFFWSGDEVWSAGFAFAEKVSRQNFSPAGRSEAFFMTFYTETAIRFQIDYIALNE